MDLTEDMKNEFESIFVLFSNLLSDTMGLKRVSQQIKNLTLS